MAYWTSTGVSQDDIDAVLNVINYSEPGIIHVAENGDDADIGNNWLHPVQTLTRANVLAAALPAGRKVIQVNGSYTYPQGTDSGTYSLPAGVDFDGRDTEFTQLLSVSLGTTRISVRKIDVGNEGNNSATFPSNCCVDVLETITGIVNYLGGVHVTSSLTCRKHFGELRMLSGTGRIYCDLEANTAPRISTDVEVIGPGIRTVKGLIHAGDPYFSVGLKDPIGTLTITAVTGSPVNVWGLTKTESKGVTASVVTVAGSEYIKIENMFDTDGVADAAYLAAFGIDFRHVSAPPQTTIWTLKAETWVDVETVPVFVEDTTFQVETDTDITRISIGGPEGFPLPALTGPVYLRYFLNHDKVSDQDIIVSFHEMFFRLLGYTAVAV